MGGKPTESEDVPLSPSQAALKLLPYTTLPAALVVRVRRCCRLWLMGGCGVRVVAKY